MNHMICMHVSGWGRGVLGWVWSFWGVTFTARRPEVLAVRFEHPELADRTYVASVAGTIEVLDTKNAGPSSVHWSNAERVDE